MKNIFIALLVSLTGCAQTISNTAVVSNTDESSQNKVIVGSGWKMNVPAEWQEIDGKYSDPTSPADYVRTQLIEIDVGDPVEAERIFSKTITATKVHLKINDLPAVLSFDTNVGYFTNLTVFSMNKIFIVRCSHSNNDFLADHCRDAIMSFAVTEHAPLSQEEVLGSWKDIE